jgi:hypothetical protein
MGTRGDLLTLVDGAPGRLRTLQAALATWTHRALVAEVNRRLVADAGVDAAAAAQSAAPPPAPTLLPGVPGAVAPANGPASPADPRPAPRHDPATPNVADDEPAESLATAYVIVALPDRWRVVGRGHLAVSDGRRSWAGTSTLVTERDSAHAAIFDAGAIGACLYPGGLLRRLDFSVPVVEDIEGRPCWFVEGGPRRKDAGRPAPPERPDRLDLRIQRELVGVEHRIWFDAATGIILRHEGFVDDEACSTTSLTDLVFDQFVHDDEFRPPPGAVVRSRHELLRDHLAAMGIDPDTVDLDDPAQVREALRQGG